MAAPHDRYRGFGRRVVEHQDALRRSDLTGYAERLGLDTERFTEDLDRPAGAARVAEDVDSADLSGVSGTPAFFANGRRHSGAYDIDTLAKAVRTSPRPRRDRGLVWLGSGQSAAAVEPLDAAAARDRACAAGVGGMAVRADVDRDRLRG